MAKAKTEIEKLVKSKAMRIVQLDDLQTDQSYQRELRPKHKRIVADFDPDSFGMPLIGQREDGGLWIVDGFQRISAIRKLGWTSVRADVFISEGPEHEAKVFTRVNLNRQALRPLEEFQSRLTAQDEKAWAIKEAVEGCGFKITKYLSPKMDRQGTTITCITSLYTLYKAHGVEAIKFALNTAKAAWPGDPLGAYRHIVMGLSHFFYRNKGIVDIERLIPRLSQTTPQKILYTVSSQAFGGSKGDATADIIERIYRKRSVGPAKRA